MRQYDESEELFANRIRSLKEKALKNDQISTLKFLDLRKQEIITQVITNKDNLYVYFDGGYSNSEYKKCMISSKEIEFPNLGINILKIKYNRKYLVPNHRMILGNLMSLGIKREVIGDIVITGEDCYIITSSEITKFLISELKVMNNVPIELELFEGVLTNEEKYDIKKCFVSSLRLDNIIAAMYNMSRNIAQEFIASDLVKVNQVSCQNNSHQVKENDIISIRGKGRMKVISVGGLSRSERIIVELGKLL